MEKYNYYDAMRDDIRNYLEERGVKLTEGNMDEIYDDMIVSDEVTGNASGSYTSNRMEAAENIMTNLDLLADAVEDFGGGMDVLKDGPEACDVTIRCYLLGQLLTEFLTEEEEEEC